MRGPSAPSAPLRASRALNTPRSRPANPSMTLRGGRAPASAGPPPNADRSRGSALPAVPPATSGGAREGPAGWQLLGRTHGEDAAQGRHLAGTQRVFVDKGGQKGDPVSKRPGAAGDGNGPRPHSRVTAMTQRRCGRLERPGWYVPVTSGEALFKIQDGALEFTRKTVWGLLTVGQERHRSVHVTSYGTKALHIFPK